MAQRAFQQVDVFSDVPFKGNPVAVVLGADGMSTEAMQGFTIWMNLSETTFLLKPTDPVADYRVRIFTPAEELPFAGHPTLGSCHAWLRAGGVPKGVRDGPVAADDLARIAAGLGISAEAIIRSQWIDNGPRWVGVMLASREELLAITPDYDALGPLEVGAVAPGKPGDETQFEVRAFASSLRVEDPVTGSLNASVAQWLIGAGIAPDSYVAAQGTALGRQGRIHISRDGETIWVGGTTTTCIEGNVEI